jgi:membrane protein YdbS with pleckstrin-like domain
MLFALAILSAYWSVVYHGIFFILTIAIIPALLLVRFKKLEIRNHEILFREWSVLPFLNEEKTIHLTSIKKVETDQGYFDKQFFVIDALFTTSYRGNTRPASIAFHLDTGETYTIVKFGDKSRFQQISKRIKTVANHT